MSFHPYKPACNANSVAVNRVAKLHPRDSQDSSTQADTLTLIKRKVDALDQLEVSNNASWVTKVTSFTDARIKQMFFGTGTDTSRLRWRYYVYGLDRAYLLTVLTALSAVI